MEPNSILHIWSVKYFPWSYFIATRTIIAAAAAATFNLVEEYMRVKCLLPKLCSIKCYAEKTTVRWILPFFGMLHKEKSWSERKQESKRPRTRQKNPRRPHNESDLYVNQPLQSIFDKTKSFYFGCILKVYEAKQMPNKTTDQKNSIKSTDRHLFGFICCFYAVGDDC